MKPADRILTVVTKELVDTFRDRRTMMVTLLTAIAAGPLFLALILNVAASQADKARELKLFDYASSVFSLFVIQSLTGGLDNALVVR